MMIYSSNSQSNFDQFRYRINVRPISQYIEVIGGYVECSNGIKVTFVGTSPFLAWTISEIRLLFKKSNTNRACATYKYFFAIFFKLF